MKTAYLCIRVATQTDGTYIFVNVEAASFDKAKVEEYFNKQAKLVKETIDGIACESVRALHEIEISE